MSSGSLGSSANSNGGGLEDAASVAEAEGEAGELTNNGTQVQGFDEKGTTANATGTSAAANV